LEQGEGGGGSTSVVVVVVVDSSVGGVAIPSVCWCCYSFCPRRSKQWRLFVERDSAPPPLPLGVVVADDVAAPSSVATDGDEDGQENGIIWVERLLFLLDVDSSASFRYLFPRRDRLPRPSRCEERRRRRSRSRCYVDRRCRLSSQYHRYYCCWVMMRQHSRRRHHHYVVAVAVVVAVVVAA